MIRLLSLFLISFLLMDCGSSSVYKMSDEDQEGITYQLYQEETSQAFEQAMNVLANDDASMLVDEEWQIESSSMEEGRIVTNWRETNNPGVGQSADGGSNERYRITAEISENDSGSRVYFQLEKQVQFTGDEENMGQWQMYEVSAREAKELLNPLFEGLEQRGLTSKD